MSEEVKYIYESPDGGKTVTRREFGSFTKEAYYGTPENSEDYATNTDCIYISDWNNANLTSGTITLDTGNINSWNGTSINGEYSSDITLVEPNSGKTYSFIDMFHRIEAIEKRLTILTPDDKLLEQYEVLQDLYAQYKAAESLLFGPEIEDEK
jgi:hypothetical protein